MIQKNSSSHPTSILPSEGREEARRSPFLSPFSKGEIERGFAVNHRENFDIYRKSP